MTATTNGMKSGSFVEGMSLLASQVSVVTTADDAGVFAGLTATAVCSLTADPATLVTAVNRSTFLGSMIRRTGVFSVNVLSEEQAEIAKVFAGMTHRTGSDRFNVGEWHLGATGAPALEGATTRFDCRVESMLARDTHWLLIGEVVDVATHHAPAGPLVYFSREFSRLSATH